MNKQIFGNVLGGVNYSNFPAYGKMPQFFMAHSQNILPTEGGYATKRGGSSKLNSTVYGSLVTSFHELIKSGTSYKFAAQGTVIGKYDSGSLAFNNHITQLTSGAYGQWLNYGGYAIYVNGSDNAKKTDGANGSDLTTDANALNGGSCIAEWGERVWVAVGATLYGSALRDPTDYSDSTTAIGYWEGTVGDTGQVIKGLFSFFDLLIIGKLNQLYVLLGTPETDSSTFRLQPLYTKENDSVGFTSPTAITQVGNELIFLDGFDIKRLSGVTQYGDIESISIIGNIKDFFKSSNGAGLDKDYLQNAHFRHYKHKEQIYCSVPTGASTRYWFVIDYSNRQLREELGLPPYSIFPMSGLTPISFGAVADGSKMLMYAGCSDGFVRLLDTGTNDTSTAIDAFGIWAFGDVEKQVNAASMILNIDYSTACSLTVMHGWGFQDWVDIINTANYSTLSTEDLTDSTWDIKGKSAHKRFGYLGGKTDKSFLLKLRHNTASQTFTMKNSLMNYRTRFKYLG